jgi:hypothetical protein
MFAARSVLVVSDRKQHQSRGTKVFYQPTPMNRGACIGAKAELLGSGAAGPVFLHLGTTFVDPTGAGYERNEGCTTDPHPPVPRICAIAAELVSASAVAIAIVVTFMILLLAV